jgi:Immunoglobulin I-set domain
MRMSLTIRTLAVFPLLWLGLIGVCRAQSFQDLFTNRETFTAASGSLIGDNATATVEPGEPKHGGKTGGHSLWVSWVAPTNGVARFKSETSGFDTLISAYYFNSTNDTTFDKLVEAARNDDSEELGDRESEIAFGVSAGQRFEIAVDGYFGATGTVKMQWSVDVTPQPPPTILSTTPDTTLRIGDSITLNVVMTNVDNGTKFQWFFNGAELLDQKATNLTIASMQETNVGRYKLQIDTGSHITFFAPSTELQINTEGASALAQSKFPDAPGTELLGGFANPPPKPNAGEITKPGLAPIGKFDLVSGYTGSQIFNTTFATTDPNEPLHCSVIGGSSYWLGYKPPANGTITLDTLGSSYDTVVEVYTYNAPPTGYQDLISLACDHDSMTNASRVQVPVIKTRQYLVAVAGVNGAKGNAKLNYSLNTNQLPQAPVLTALPQTVVAASGANVTLTPPVVGSPPLYFSWTKDTVVMTNSYSAALSLQNVSPIQGGDYLVTVTNELGLAKAVMPLHVVIPPICNVAASNSNTLQLAFPTQSGLHYFVEQASDLRGPWQLLTNNIVGDGQPVAFALPTIGTGFYRVRVE